MKQSALRIHVPFIPEELSCDARDLWPRREDMPTPEAVSMILRKTAKNPVVRLEIISWLRRNAVSRGEELLGVVATLIAIVAVAITATSAFPPVVAVVVPGILALAFLLLLGKAADLVADLGERSRHATAWLGAIEDAVALERQGKQRWWWFTRP